MQDSNYSIVDFDQIDSLKCPCGFSRRAFADSSDSPASMHIVQIEEDSRVHYHRKLTEIYYVLEGEGQMYLDGQVVDIEPGIAVMIKPYCRHRAIGKLKIMNVVMPCFDPEDEWFDDNC